MISNDIHQMMLTYLQVYTKGRCGTVKTKIGLARKPSMMAPDAPEPPGVSSCTELTGTAGASSSGSGPTSTGASASSSSQSCPRKRKAPEEASSPQKSSSASSSGEESKDERGQVASGGGATSIAAATTPARRMRRQGQVASLLLRTRQVLPITQLLRWPQYRRICWPRVPR